ncbi:hypothetical protein ACUXVY_12585 [Chromobacterium haemolyticum]|uniref:hypothetical protein n=1 Tax=Chromobacterium haemolyticum TaxID=394935 RepID=UPI004056AFCE
MAARYFDELPSDEKQDFLDSCHRFGVHRDDFNIYFDEGLPIGGVIGHFKREVHIQLIRTGVGKVYQAGWRTNWNAEFEADLSSGFFG